jgi:hypothetical protein
VIRSETESLSDALWMIREQEKMNAQTEIAMRVKKATNDTGNQR